MGYTPAFDTLYTGTLCGRWPEAAVMASLLPLVDARGEINMSYQAIHALTGWPLDLLEQGIKQLMEPDPYSRSPDNDGRRLVLVDPARPWGWRLVNHAKYREKARKSMHDAERTASGADAERKRAERAASRDVPTRPDASRSHTHTQTHTKTPTSSGASKVQNGAGGEPREPPPPKPRGSRKVALPADFTLDAELGAYAATKIPDANIEAMFEAFCGDARAKGWKYADWRQAWQTYVRNSAPNSGHWAAGQYPRKDQIRWM